MTTATPAFHKGTQDSRLSDGQMKYRARRLLQLTAGIRTCEEEIRSFNPRRTSPKPLHQWRQELEQHTASLPEALNEAYAAIAQGHIASHIALADFLDTLTPKTYHEGYDHGVARPLTHARQLVLCELARKGLYPEDDKRELFDLALNNLMTSNDLKYYSYPATALATSIASEVIGSIGTPDPTKDQRLPSHLRYHVAALASLDFGINSSNLNTRNVPLTESVGTRLGILDDEIARQLTAGLAMMGNIQYALNGALHPTVDGIELAPLFRKLHDKHCPNNHMTLQAAATAAHDLLAGDLRDQHPAETRNRFLDIAQKTYFPDMTWDGVKSVINTELARRYSPAPSAAVGESPRQGLN